MSLYYHLHSIHSHTKRNGRKYFECNYFTAVRSYRLGLENKNLHKITKMYMLSLFAEKSPIIDLFFKFKSQEVNEDSQN